MKPRWSSLEHSVAALWNEGPEVSSSPDGVLWVAFSGGADSVLLADVLWRLQRIHQKELRLLHVHHGSEEPGVRDLMQSFCEAWAFARGIPLRVEKWSGVRALRGERECRDFRWQVFRETLTGSDILSLGHHFQDLLETRFLRLWRGTGREGLEGMRCWKGRVFRPFLSVAKRQILDQVRARGLAYMDDPGNLHLDADRNWLRHVLFPQIEARRPGSLKAMARSFDLMVSGPPISRGVLKKAEILTLSSFDFSQFADSDPVETSRCLHLWLQAQGVGNLRASQVAEVLKQLRGDAERTIFLSGVGFRINAQQIRRM